MVGSSNGARKTGKAECTPSLYLSTRDPPPFPTHALSLVEALVGTPLASPLVGAPPPGWLHRHSPVSSYTSCHTTNPRCSSSASKVCVRHRQEGLLLVDWPTLRHGVATCMLDRCARASLPWCPHPHMRIVAEGELYSSPSETRSGRLNGRAGVPRWRCNPSMARCCEGQMAMVRMVSCGVTIFALRCYQPVVIVADF
jgi:hypothetical protein